MEIKEELGRAMQRIYRKSRLTAPKIRLSANAYAINKFI